MKDRGKWKNRNREQGSEGTEEITTFPFYHYLLQGQQALPNHKPISVGPPVTKATAHFCLTQPPPTSNCQPIKLLDMLTYWMTEQIQISWLLKKPTDLDPDLDLRCDQEIHVCKSKAYSGSVGLVNFICPSANLYRWAKIYRSTQTILWKMHKNIHCKQTNVLEKYVLEKKTNVFKFCFIFADMAPSKRQRERNNDNCTYTKYWADRLEQVKTQIWCHRMQHQIWVFTICHSSSSFSHSNK